MLRLSNRRAALRALSAQRLEKAAERVLAGRRQRSAYILSAACDAISAVSLACNG